MNLKFRLFNAKIESILNIFTKTCVLVVAILANFCVPALGNPEPPPSTLELIRLFQSKVPAPTHAHFNISNNSEIIAISRLTDVESLDLDCRASGLDLTPLSSLPKLTELYLSLSSSEIPTLETLSTIPKLTKLSIFWRGHTKGQSGPTIISLPRIKPLTTLYVSGFNCAFNIANLSEQLQSLSLDAPLTKDSHTSKLKNLVALRDGLRFRNSGIESLAAFYKLENYTGKIPTSVPNWKSIKLLTILNPIDAKQLTQICNLTSLELLDVKIKDCSDNAIELLGNLPRLRTLRLSIEPTCKNGEVYDLPPGSPGKSLSALANCKSLEDLSIDNFPINEHIFNSLGEIHSLKSLYVSPLESALSPKLFRPLNHLENLEYLWVCGSSDLNCYKELTSLSKLRRVSLGGTDLEDKDIDILLNFPNVESLDLGHNKLTDACFDTFAKLTNLQYLDLSNNCIHGLNIDRLTKLPKLQYLNLELNPISDDALLESPLSSNSIETLKLSQTKICGKGLLAVKGCTALKDLDLEDTPIDDDSLQYLSSPTLEKLDLRNTEITEHGIAKLSHVPNLHYIVVDGCGIKYGANLPPKPRLRYMRQGPPWMMRQPDAHLYEYKFDQKESEGLYASTAQALFEQRQRVISKYDYKTRGDLHFALGNYDEAIKEYQNCIDSRMSLSFRLPGGGFARGHVSASGAARFMHDKFECYDRLGTAFAELKQYDKALEAHNKAVNLCRASAVARMHRAEVLLTMHNYEGALRDLNRAIDIKPDLFKAYDYKDIAIAGLKKASDAKAN